MKKYVVLLTLLAVMFACFGCASSRNPSRYPILEPLDPVTNQEIQYVR
jgi:hypothetical protein